MRTTTKKTANALPVSWTAVAKAARAAYDQGLPVVDDSASRALARSVMAKKGTLLQSAERFGTPHYLLDEDAVSSHAREFRESFIAAYPKTRCFYAFKSNDLPSLIGILKREGFHADVASGLEFELALRLGFQTIIFTAPTKSDEELLLSLRHADRVVLNIDDPEELTRLELLAEKVRGPRLRVSFRLDLTEKGSAWSKFGILPGELGGLVGRLDSSKRLAFTGVHSHASWNRTPAGYLRRLRMLAKLLREELTLAQRDRITFIDLGGGFLPQSPGAFFSDAPMAKLLDVLDLSLPSSQRHQPITDPVTSIDAFASAIGTAFRKEIAPLFSVSPELWIEPGRYLSTSSTSIVLKVMSSRKGHLYVDGGIQMLGSATPTFEYLPVINISRPSFERQASIIYGPLCDPEDLWGYSYYGNAARAGDLLVVPCQGAYTFASAWRWQRPIPRYVIGKGKTLRLAKEEETFSQRYAGCVMPRAKEK